MTSSPTTSPPSASVRSADGTTIAYERNGTGPALILVDAAGGFRGFGPMRPLAALLADTFTVFTYDRRGRGESGDTPPYAVEREVEDLAALIAEAGGSASLYGFSSGAVLALLAAAHGLPVRRLVLLEPPIAGDDEPADTGLGAELAELVAAGRRGDAVAHFQTSIGVPAELTEGMRESPAWPAMEALAHTLVYDTLLTRALPMSRLSTVTPPTLVIDSEASDERLHGWSRRVADALPNGRHRGMPGEWHGVPAEDLAVAIREFLATP